MKLDFYKTITILALLILLIISICYVQLNRYTYYLEGGGNYVKLDRLAGAVSVYIRGVRVRTYPYILPQKR